jgi:catechol 2,3-dioxygenase-like lactoylglutathione lyase family enzyme
VSTTQALRAADPKAQSVGMKLEVITIPVSDADRAKRFYGSLGWRLDADITKANAFRIVQFTPRESACSIQFGTGLTSAKPGSAQRVYLVVADIEAARADLIAHGVDVGDVFHLGGPEGRQSGPDPAHASYASYASFNDPDGNSWLLQEVTLRLPNRVEADNTSFGSSGELAGALRRAEAAHGQHEKRTGKRDENWAERSADYIVREQAGKELPS